MKLIKSFFDTRPRKIHWPTFNYGLGNGFTIGCIVSLLLIDFSAIALIITVLCVFVLTKLSWYETPVDDNTSKQFTHFARWRPLWDLPLESDQDDEWEHRCIVMWRSKENPGDIGVEITNLFKIRDGVYAAEKEQDGMWRSLADSPVFSRIPPEFYDGFSGKASL